MLKILCIGPQWRGSNAGGLFKALSRTGQLIEIVDENYFLNLSNSATLSKATNKLLRPVQIKEFNNAIVKTADNFKPDIAIIYKGAFVLPSTVLKIKKKIKKVINFYPDVSFKVHGSLLPKTLPLYDYIFTTKTFGIKDMDLQLGIKKSCFIPHGFDPDIHRPIDIANFDITNFQCDVSFIGGYSEKKESYLSILKKNLPEINLKIWGPRWENSKEKNLRSSIMNRSIHGDLYTVGILSSKINLGLLHERVSGASSGDKITSRTFHIPGAGGFMLHEQTDEVELYFEAEKEIDLFNSPEELTEKVKYYLQNESARTLIQQEGTRRAWRDHSLDKRALSIIEKIKQI